MKKYYMLLRGLSLIEVLVVITIFAVLGILVTQSVALTLIGSKKSESMVKARENLDYSLSIIERQIRNANFVYGDADYISPCPNIYPNIIYYEDQDGNKSSFSCINSGFDNSYVASGSARLTTETVKIVSCSFICTPGNGSDPALVEVNLELKEASASLTQSANVSASTQIYLRNY